MSKLKTVDARELPERVFDHRAPVWWGNLWLIVILSTFAMLALGSYFYLADDFRQWPPTQSNTYPAILRPLPPLTYSSAIVAVLLVGCLPAALADWAARNGRSMVVRIALLLVALTGIGTLALHYFQLQALPFRWDDNAYGSIVWAIVVLHLLFVFTATVEMLLVLGWCLGYDVDEKHAFQITVFCFFWYWTALIWLPMYLVVYWSPRWM